MKRILFVCTGNICRSPTADGVLRHMSDTQGLNLEVDSAGTHSYHVGEAPDARTQHTAKAKGYDISHLRARKVTASDFTHYDLILAMDLSHLTQLLSLRPSDATADIELFLDYVKHPTDSEVPDPYYGSQSDFEEVLQLCEEGCQKLISLIS